MSHYHSPFQENGLLHTVLSLRNVQYDDGVENAPGNLLPEEFDLAGKMQTSYFSCVFETHLKTK